jgi:hypothetical protein
MSRRDPDGADLQRLWEAGRPPEPDDARWADVLRRIADAVEKAGTTGPRSVDGRSAPRLGAVPARAARWWPVAAAAVFLIALVDFRAPRHAGNEPGDPLPAAFPDDAGAAGVPDSDTSPVVADQPSPRDPLTPAPGEDVAEDVQPKADGGTPQAQVPPSDTSSPATVGPPGVRPAVEKAP